MTGSPVTIAEACQRAARILAAGRAERDAIAASGGAQAVAKWASPHCTEAEKAELAEYYEQLQQQAGSETAA